MAGVPVRALIDSGATTTCCSRQWYRRYHAKIGPLVHDQIQVIDVENTPIFVDGRTVRLPLEWKEATFLVVPMLIEPDVILGMDLLQQLGVRIDTQAVVAEPTVLVSCVRPLETWHIPATARKSVFFFTLKIPLKKKLNVLFEPSEKLPAAIRETTSLGSGEKIYVCIENVSEEEQILNPDWEIGTMEVVEEEPDFPWAEAEEAGLSPLPDQLSAQQQQQKRTRLVTRGIPRCIRREGI